MEGWENRTESVDRLTVVCDQSLQVTRLREEQARRALGAPTVAALGVGASATGGRAPVSQLFLVFVYPGLFPR